MECTANSEMVRQLVRRAQLLAPLPRHRTQGLTRHEMLETAFAHLDVDGGAVHSAPHPPKVTPAAAAAAASTRHCFIPRNQWLTLYTTCVPQLSLKSSVRCKRFE